MASGNSFNWVTLVASGGTPVRLADQTGAPLPTTGTGSLVYANNPILTNAQLVAPLFTQPFGFGPGTAAAPAIFFRTSDQSTGIFSNAVAHVDVSISGVQIADWNSTGYSVTGNIAATGNYTGTWQGNTVAAVYGGTGISSYVIGDLLYANGTTTLARLAAVATPAVLTSTGVGAAPAWAATTSVAVTSLSFGTTGLTPSAATTGVITVAGTLVVANGGTGVTTSTGTGSVVLSNSPTLVTPTLGAASATSVTASGSPGIVNDIGGANGYVALFPGTPSTAGYIAFFDHARARIGYIGFIEAMLNLTADGANPVQISSPLRYGGVTLANSVTGTGSMVLATSPTLVTPVLGVATATSLAIGGATIGANALAVTGTALFNNAVTASTTVAIGGATIGANALAVTGTVLFNNAVTMGSSLTVSTVGFFIGGSGNTYIALSGTLSGDVVTNSAGRIGFAPTSTNAAVAPDTGLKRVSAGVMEVDNGNAGALATMQFLTQAAGDNTVNGATTAFVQSAIAGAASFGTRQTVPFGPSDANGIPTFLPATSVSLTLTMQNVTGSVPFIATAANGWSATTGLPVNRVGVTTTNLSWTLPASQTSYLYVIVAANGTLTTGSTTLVPIYQMAGTPAVTNGQFTFLIQGMTGFLGNGTTAPQSYIVFVGEAVTNLTTVTSTVAYAYNGFYDSGFTATLPAASSATSFNTNLGITPRIPDMIFECITNDGSWVVGDQLTMTSGISTVTTQFIQPTLTSSRNVTVLAAANNATPWQSVPKTGGNVVALTPANWKYKILAFRGW